MELKEKLVMLRREQGLTQDELAQKVGVTRQAVSKWERGVIAPSTVNLIALGRLYGVPLDDLANSGLRLEERPAVAAAVVEAHLYTKFPPPTGRAPTISDSTPPRPARGSTATWPRLSMPTIPPPDPAALPVPDLNFSRPAPGAGRPPRFRAFHKILP